MTQEGPGSILKKARLMQNYHIEEVVSYLGVSQAFMEALEKDLFYSPLLKNVEKLKSCYTRYANYLNMNTESIHQAYENFLTQSDQYKTAIPIQSTLKRIRWIIILAILFGAIELIYWSLHKRELMSEFLPENSSRERLETSLNDGVLNELKGEELSRNHSRLSFCQETFLISVSHYDSSFFAAIRNKQ